MSSNAVSSYTKTFYYSQALNGADKTHHMYTLSLKPLAPTSGKASSLYHAHYSSALRVEITDLVATIVMPTVTQDKSGGYGGVAIVGKDHSITDASDLSTTGEYAISGGKPVSASVSRVPGINPILKGVAADGVEPAVVVGVYSDWDASSSVVALLNVRLTCRFEGDSNASMYDKPFSKAV